MNGLTRQQIIDELLPFIKQVITQEQYDRAGEFINGLSDYEFQQLLAEIVYKAKEAKPITPKEYSALVKQMRELNGITSETTALNSYSVSYLTDEENSRLWKSICRTKPSDMVSLKGKDDDALCELWKKGCSGNFAKNGYIPSDLFFAGNIPLLDCAITVDERDKDNEKGQVCDYRVVVFEDYQERIKKADGDATEVGAVVITKNGRSMFIPMMVCEGMDTIMIGEIGWNNVSAERRENTKRYVSQQGITAMAYAHLVTWYGIQVALLHPTVKNVFKNPSTERVYNPDAKKNRKHKRVTRYIKRHIINSDDIEAALYGTGREFTRHTLVWYVIGHWRCYADGRKVFIQPYWKGALRELKMNLDDREREIAIGGTV